MAILKKSARRITQLMLIGLLATGPALGPVAPAYAAELSPGNYATDSQFRETEVQNAPTGSATEPASDNSPSPAEQLSSDPSFAGNLTMEEVTADGGAVMGQGLATEQEGSGPGGDTNGTDVSALASTSWIPTVGVPGMDVSGHQPQVDWQGQWNMGARFAYVKATEGTYHRNSVFGSQYQGARGVGMLRGAYHFAIPNWSSGAEQARYFVSNGGGWTSDGYTLPHVLDFETNPYAGRTIDGYYFGNSCYDMTPGQLVNWVRDFSNTVATLTGRLPVIYTTTSWWKHCTADAAGFGNNPLWVAAWPYAPTNSPGPIPSSWDTYSLWQYSDSGPFAGDSNIWNGSYSSLVSFANNGVPSRAFSEIAAKHSSTPALGAAEGGIICGLRNGGCYRLFANGAIIWSPDTGAQASLYGPLRTRWAAESFENGPLGYPLGDVQCGLKDAGCYQLFQGGAIIWSSASGAHTSLYGAIRNRWGAESFENGVLGYPTSGTACGLKDGGCYQFFQKGVIVWSPATGAQTSLYGPIRDRWSLEGYENGSIGYPTGGATCGLPNDGCYQLFQNGAVIWSPATGAHVSKFGVIRAKWASSNFERGFLGYPTGPEICGLVRNGCYQMYQGGAILWSAETGARISKFGAIRGTWAASGSERGPLGYPTTDEACGLRNGGCYQMFERGAIIWSPQTGAHSSPYGGIRQLWGSLGFENGRLGYPTSSESCTAGLERCSQLFEYGRVDWTPARGPYATF